MLMALGHFIFKISTLAYSELQRQTSWRHASANRVGVAPAYQSLGRGDDTINLTGTVYKEIGQPESLDTIRSMADAGEAYALVDGESYVYGQWAVTGLSEESSFFTSNGKAKRTGFTIALLRVDSTQQPSSNNKNGKLE